MDIDLPPWLVPYFELAGGGYWPQGKPSLMRAMAAGFTGVGEVLDGLGASIPHLSRSVSAAVGGAAGIAFFARAGALSHVGGGFSGTALTLHDLLLDLALNTENAQLGLFVATVQLAADFVIQAFGPALVVWFQQQLVVLRARVARIIEIWEEWGRLIREQIPRVLSTLDGLSARIAKYLGDDVGFRIMDQAARGAGSALIPQAIQDGEHERHGFDATAVGAATGMGALGGLVGAFAGTQIKAHVDQAVTELAPDLSEHDAAVVAGLTTAGLAGASSGLLLGGVSVAMGGDVAGLGLSVLSGGVAGVALHTAGQTGAALASHTNGTTHEITASELAALRETGGLAGFDGPVNEKDAAGLPGLDGWNPADRSKAATGTDSTAGALPHPSARPAVDLSGLGPARATIDDLARPAPPVRRTAVGDPAPRDAIADTARATGPIGQSTTPDPAVARPDTPPAATRSLADTTPVRAPRIRTDHTPPAQIEQAGGHDQRTSVPHRTAGIPDRAEWRDTGGPGGRGGDLVGIAGARRADADTMAGGPAVVERAGLAAAHAGSGSTADAADAPLFHGANATPDEEDIVGRAGAVEAVVVGHDQVAEPPGAQPHHDMTSAAGPADRVAPRARVDGVDLVHMDPRLRSSAAFAREQLDRLDGDQRDWLDLVGATIVAGHHEAALVIGDADPVTAERFAVVNRDVVALVAYRYHIHEAEAVVAGAWIHDDAELEPHALAAAREYSDGLATTLGTRPTEGRLRGAGSLLKKLFGNTEDDRRVNVPPGQGSSHGQTVRERGTATRGQRPNRQPEPGDGPQVLQRPDPQRPEAPRKRTQSAPDRPADTRRPAQTLPHRHVVVSQIRTHLAERAKIEDRIGILNRQAKWRQEFLDRLGNERKVLSGKIIPGFEDLKLPQKVRDKIPELERSMDIVFGRTNHEKVEWQRGYRRVGDLADSFQKTVDKISRLERLWQDAEESHLAVSSRYFADLSESSSQAIGQGEALRLAFEEEASSARNLLAAMRKEMTLMERIEADYHAARMLSGNRPSVTGPRSLMYGSVLSHVDDAKIAELLPANRHSHELKSYLDRRDVGKFFDFSDPDKLSLLVTFSVREAKSFPVSLYGDPSIDKDVVKQFVGVIKDGLSAIAVWGYDFAPHQKDGLTVYLSKYGESHLVVEPDPKAPGFLQAKEVLVPPRGISVGLAMSSNEIVLTPQVLEGQHDTVVHEFGHLAHSMTEVGRNLERTRLRDGKVVMTEEQKRIALKVSKYAAKDPFEFVAETFLALVRGWKVPDDVYQSYLFFGGPKFRLRPQSSQPVAGPSRGPRAGGPPGQVRDHVEPRATGGGQLRVEPQQAPRVLRKRLPGG